MELVKFENLGLMHLNFCKKSLKWSGNNYFLQIYSQPVAGLRRNLLVDFEQNLLEIRIVPCIHNLFKAFICICTNDLVREINFPCHN